MTKVTQPPGDDPAAPDSDDGDAPGRDISMTAPALEVDVARSGGFAGVTRRWSAQPPEEEASDWISLIDRCPWDHPTSHDGDEGAAMPDRFVWWIRASIDADPREAEVPDDELTGAWRELVDAVREWNRTVGRPSPDPR
jgi:hypothetical protein